MELPQAHIDADKELVAIADQVRLADHTTPINADKAEFFADTTVSPIFSYRHPELPADLLTKLDAIEIPDDEIGQLLKSFRDEIRLRIEMITNIGNRKIWREGSAKLFGRPTPELIADAEQIITGFVRSERPSEELLSSEEVQQAFESKLTEIGLTKWRVEISKNVLGLTTGNRVIRIPVLGQFRAKDLDAFINHEIGTHALRTENGHQQPFKILSIGTPSYLETEEGLAVFGQKITGTLYKEHEFIYAGRVIAVDCVHRGLDFAATFEKLTSYGKFTRDQAYNLTLRAHRGGGYLRDHVYLAGLRKIEKFVLDGGDIRDLYVGKIAIEQLALIQTLRAAEIVKEPEHLPWFPETANL